MARDWTRSGGPPPPQWPNRSASNFKPSPVYRRRRPEETPLYQVVQHHLETYLAMAEADEVAYLPPWTEHDSEEAPSGFSTVSRA